MALRVLRLIEYTYENGDRMASDMLHWNHSHKDATMSMKSAYLIPESVEWVDTDGT